MGLSMGQNFSGREIVKVLVICDNVTGSTSTFQVVLLDTESLENGQEFFVMDVIVVLRRAEGTGMEYNGAIQDPVSKYGSSSESHFQGFKGFLGCISEVPQHTFMGEPCEQNHNIRVI